jgi:hypothetical protein
LPRFSLRTATHSSPPLLSPEPNPADKLDATTEEKLHRPFEVSVDRLNVFFLLAFFVFITVGGRFTYAFSSSFSMSLDLLERVELVKLVRS